MLVDPQKRHNYRIVGGFRGHLFLRISASRENIFREMLGATPSARSAPTWVWSGLHCISIALYCICIALYCISIVLYCIVLVLHCIVLVLHCISIVLYCIVLY